MIAEPIGWWNTGVPLVVLGVLALILPRWFTPHGTRLHRDVALAVWAAAGVLLLVGGVVFALIYRFGGVDVWGAFRVAPVSVSMFFLGLSGFAAILWGPLLVLMWLGLAQGVEKRKGEDRALR